LISTQEMLVRLAAATVLGGLIGAERERVESTVGLRTHAIVALGSATFMLVSMFGFSNAGGPPGVVLYPSRVAAQIVTAVAAPLAPATHADFRYYTFALTWQPGICGTDEGCLADQPTTDLIGLHGLWASLPQTLIDRGVVPQQWWQRGCDYFEHTDAAPPLDGALAQRLERVVPHFTQDLLTHEYDKHVACFRFDPTQFFTTELAMHDAVVAIASAGICCSVKASRSGMPPSSRPLRRRSQRTPPPRCSCAAGTMRRAERC
jgi:hypothetical protein